MGTPVSAKRVNDQLDALEKKASQLMRSENIAASRQRFEFSLDVRHKGQINEVEVPLPWERVPANYEPLLRKAFVDKYEKALRPRLGACRRAARNRGLPPPARALTPRPKLVSKKSGKRTIPRGAKRTTRSIYWPDLKKYRATPVFDGDNLLIGNQLKGPAIVETADTTVVVHPGRTLRLDPLGNFEITF
jgi:N-methylhydantoinase A